MNRRLEQSARSNGQLEQLLRAKLPARPRGLLFELPFESQRGATRVRQVLATLARYGFDPHQTLVRVFDTNYLSKVCAEGTDRAGMDLPGQDRRKTKWEDLWEGRLALMQQKNLKREDVLCCFYADQLQPRVLRSGVPSENRKNQAAVGLAVYYPGSLALLEHDMFYFSHPRNKTEALAGVFFDPH